MALHIKTLQVPSGDHTLFVDLQFAKDDKGDLGVRTRITRKKARSNEKFAGYASVNRAGELFRFTETDAITESEQSAIEREILGAVGE